MDSFHSQIKYGHETTKSAQDGARVKDVTVDVDKLTNFGSPVMKVEVMSDDNS